ncbi:MAG: hypothetical protein KKH92_08520 [Firmicutes bacterium]|nr:hypothetical protein [Bacillota bacterium]
MKIEKSSTLPFNHKVSFKEFQDKVQIFDFVSTLMSLQKLSVFLSNQSAVNINLEYEFHTGPRVKHTVLLPKDFISFTAKQCILKCKPSDLEYNDLDLVKLAYEYGNIETDLDSIDPKSENAWLWVLRATNHQWFYLRDHSSIMGRYLYLFEKVFEDAPDLKRQADESLGIDFFDILKIGTCIYSHFCPRPEGFATSFEMSNFTGADIEELKPLLTKENIDKFMAVFSIRQGGFRTENDKYKVSDDLLKKYEFNPLKRYPVIKTECEESNKQFIIPSLPDFLYACFEGIYYVLLERFEQEKQDTLLQSFGKQFEIYIGELMSFYNIPTFSHGSLLPEQTYKVGKSEFKSADWIIVSEKFIFQIECKKRKLSNYAKVGIEDETVSDINSFLKSVSKELDKFPSKEKHIAKGEVDKIKYDGQEFVNIIVYLDEMFALNRFARDMIKSSMNEKTDNFYILGCWEFELLCQHASDKHINLKDALDDVVNKKTEVYSISFLGRIYNKFFKSLISN